MSFLQRAQWFSEEYDTTTNRESSRQHPVCGAAAAAAAVMRRCDCTGAVAAGESVDAGHLADDALLALAGFVHDALLEDEAVVLEAILARGRVVVQGEAAGLLPLEHVPDLRVQIDS
jgi:hypothetical protein